MTNFIGWGTWIRTKIDGVRVRSSTVELSPTDALSGETDGEASGLAFSRGVAAAKTRRKRPAHPPIAGGRGNQAVRAAILMVTADPPESDGGLPPPNDLLVKEGASRLE